MALSPALTAMNLGLGDQLAQQTKNEIDARKKKQGLSAGSPMANGGPGSVNLSPAASLLFGGKL